VEPTKQIFITWDRSAAEDGTAQRHARAGDPFGPCDSSASVSRTYTCGHWSGVIGSITRTGEVQ